MGPWNIIPTDVQLKWCSSSKPPTWRRSWPVQLHSASVRGDWTSITCVNTPTAFIQTLAPAQDPFRIVNDVMHWSAKGVCLPDDEPKSSNCGNGHVASKVSFVVDAWTTEPVCFARTKGHVEMHESNVGASRASGFMIDVNVSMFQCFI